MILPAPKHFKVIKGVTFDYPFQFLNDLSPKDPSSINLTGWTGTWTIRWTSGGGGATTLTTGASLGTSGIFFGGSVHDPTNGLIDLVIVASDTAAIPWTVATYTLRLTDTLNNVYQLLEGGIGVIG